MKYIALFRGINVGGNNKIEMKKLKGQFESLGYTNVQTYINSGNIIFYSTKTKKIILAEILTNLKNSFGVDISILIKTQKEIRKIAEAIPKKWQNNDEQKTDVAYLFKEVDHPEIIEGLPIKPEFMAIRYVSGALIWNVSRKNYNKSHLNKLISHRTYKYMTVRNVNTARVLAEF